MRSYHPLDPTIQDFFPQLLQAPLAVIHPRTQVLNHLVAPALGGEIHFQPFDLTVQIVFLIPARYPRLGNRQVGFHFLEPE